MEFRDLKKQYHVLRTDIDEAIADVVSSAHFISGQQVNELEAMLADYVGVQHCITCGNGTDALTLALMAWDIGKGDAVFVPDFTFFSSGECPASLGATVVLVDVKPDSYNMDPEKLEEAIIRVKKEDVYNPRAVVAVDLFGLPADYDKIREICNKHGLYLLEDGAQGFGGKLHDKRACSFGDIATTSFFPAKPLGCYGDGGAVFTDNAEWADLIRSLAVHGKSKNNKYDNLRLGMNSRLDTVQAAILIKKFVAFDKYELNDVNSVADLYSKYLADTPLKLPVIKKGFYSSWAQYTVQLPENIDRNSLMSGLKTKGIPTMIYYMKPMHKQIAFSGTYSQKSDCPITEKLCKTVLSLPMHPYMGENDIKYVADEIKNLI